MPDRMKSKRFDFYSITKTSHKMLSHRKRFPIVFLTERSFIQADKYMIPFNISYEQPFLPPLKQCSPQISCHGQPIVFFVASFSFLCPESDPVVTKINIIPFKLKYFTTPCR